MKSYILFECLLEIVPWRVCLNCRIKRRAIVQVPIVVKSYVSNQQNYFVFGSHLLKSYILFECLLEFVIDP